VKTDKTKYLFVLGDINADFNTVNGRKLNNMCIQQNLQCLVDKPTRITNTTATILDQILTNASNFVNKVEVIPPVSTNDHCTVAAYLNFRVRKDPAYERLIWQYKEADFTQFKSAVSETKFDECFQTNDIDDVADKWTEKFLNVARACVPNKVVTIRLNDSPWYTAELRVMKRKLQRLFHKCKNRHQPADWENYTTARTAYQKSLDEAEIKF
jgi:hypothetical protein